MNGQTEFVSRDMKHRQEFHSLAVQSSRILISFTKALHFLLTGMSSGQESSRHASEETNYSDASFSSSEYDSSDYTENSDEDDCNTTDARQERKTKS